MMNYIGSLKRIFNQPSNKDRKLKTFNRILWWKFNQIFIKAPTVVELVPDIRCICYPDSSYGSLIVYQGFPEYSEMNFLLNIFRVDDVFIDVGANMGAISLLAASKIKKGRVFAFEPAGNCLDNLYQNLKLNGLEGKIKVIEKVVSDVSGKERFILEKHSEINHISSASEEEKKKAVLLSSVTLDDFAKSEQLKKVDVLKVDVEGAENKVIRGFGDYINKGLIEIMVIEVNENNCRFGESEEGLVRSLLDGGYLIYRFTKDGSLKKYNSIENSERVFNIVAAHKSAAAQKRLKLYREQLKRI